MIDLYSDITRMLCVVNFFSGFCLDTLRVFCCDCTFYPLFILQRRHLIMPLLQMISSTSILIENPKVQSLFCLRSMQREIGNVILVEIYQWFVWELDKFVV